MADLIYSSRSELLHYESGHVDRLAFETLAERLHYESPEADDAD